ncbi:MAG: hypothetical protein K2M19_07175 [Muribaculaceae bacterium]|nr:hypothetical protein [Muribaculaceae bacterium]
MARSSDSKGCVAAVGTFDGFHRGHRAIIGRVLDECHERGQSGCVITFDNHPLSVIAPARAPQWAYPRTESERLIREAGIEQVIKIPFTAELKGLTAEEFMRHIRNEYGVETLVMGYDNTFGSDRLTSPQQYDAAGEAAGVRVINVPPVELADGSRPSSSALRHALVQGDIDRYIQLSDHYPMLSGPVMHGKQNGRKIGIPTMNVDTGDLCLPEAGVYAAKFKGADGSRPAVLNVGKNPTVGPGNPVTVELHVPDMELGDMYGKDIRFEITRRIRPERRFSSLDELRRAIAADIAASRE